MKGLLAQPRGFCAEVVRAIDIVQRALEKYGPPIAENIEFKLPAELSN